MDRSASPPLVFPRLLADRKGALSALLLEFGAGESEALPALTEHPDFRSLAGQVPCLFNAADSARIPPALAEALQGAGCQPAPVSAIHRGDGPLDQSFAPDVQWLLGDWYLAPPAKPLDNQAASRAMALQLVQLVAADADNHALEAVFRRDPALSYHLLRIVNSLGVGASRRITSFSQAILILGRQQLRRWLNLMLFAARDGDQRSAMLLARVAVRARAMELLARMCGLDKTAQEQSFMAGMFSLLGVLFGLPLDEVLRPLMISDALRAAVLTRDGEIGRLLGLLETAERGDFAALAEMLTTLQVAPAEFNRLIMEANHWMLDVARDSQGRADA